MKKLLSVMLIMGVFTALTLDKREAKMNIDKAELIDKERKIVDLIDEDLSNTIFDFNVDQTIESIQFNTYKLNDDKWNKISGSGGYAFREDNGRIALNVEELTDEMNIALQSEHTNVSVNHTILLTDKLNNMNKVTAYLNHDMEIEYDKEIPLIILAFTIKNEISSYNIKHFNSPKEYKRLGYDYAYAVTVTFSQKTLSEFDRL